jgi:glycosyltransferase involved in cell wall biosynthesis
MRLSICTTLKNRSRVETEHGLLHLFPDFVASLRDLLIPEDDAELVVSDWASTDWPLRMWLDEASGELPVQIVNIQESKRFSRGAGLNGAALAAEGDTLLFLDVDMRIPRALLDRGHAVVQEGGVFFPVCRYYLDPDHTEGDWAEAGLGCAMIKAQTFAAIGGWPVFWEWGYADTVLYSEISKRFPVVREKVEGFVHVWHPPACERSRLLGQVGRPLDRA